MGKNRKKKVGARFFLLNIISTSPFFVRDSTACDRFFDVAAAKAGGGVPEASSVSVVYVPGDVPAGDTDEEVAELAQHVAESQEAELVVADGAGKSWRRRSHGCFFLTLLRDSN